MMKQSEFSKRNFSKRLRTCLQSIKRTMSWNKVSDNNVNMLIIIKIHWFDDWEHTLLNTKFITKYHRDIIWDNHLLHWRKVSSYSLWRSFLWGLRNQSHQARNIFTKRHWNVKSIKRARSWIKALVDNVY